MTPGSGMNRPRRLPAKKPLMVELSWPLSANTLIRAMPFVRGYEICRAIKPPEAISGIFLDLF
jgi:hypothetical protein